MTIAGIGACPMGLAPYGYGTPATAPVPGGKVFKDENGIQQNSIKLNTATGSYDYDTYGNPVGEPGVRQMVKLALLTIAGTSVASSMGNNYRDIRDIGSDFSTRVENETRKALQPLVQQGLVEYLGVSSEQIGPNRAFIRVRYRDLTTNRIEEESI